MLIQAISVVGACLVLGAYAALQMQRLTSESMLFQLMNFAGAFFLCVAALESRQLGLILIEGAWTLISAWGAWRVGRRHDGTAAGA